MKPLPPRQSLVAQTVAALREAIEAGEWPQFLPGENELSARLRVSRGTLRLALRQLEREGWVRSAQGRRREIRHRNQTAPARSRTVLLLSPAPLHRLEASAMVWIDELRERMAAEDYRLEVVASVAAYAKRPASPLQELSRQWRPAGWVLYRSTPEMQRWFDQGNLPAVIIGSRHPGINLSSVDVDYAAACRHAAGVLRAQGHQRLALVRARSELAGDLASVAAFQDGAREAEVVDTVHDGTPRGVVKCLERWEGLSARPSGLLVFHAVHVLTVLGWLQQQGRAVPGEVAVICRDDEPFLEAMLPVPARYAIKAQAFARKVSSVVSAMVQGRSGPGRAYRLIPALVGGATLKPLGKLR